MLVAFDYFGTRCLAHLYPFSSSWPCRLKTTWPDTRPCESRHVRNTADNSLAFFNLQAVACAP